jgi:hypothetical protein
MEIRTTCYELGDQVIEKLEKYLVNKCTPPQIMEIIHELNFLHQVTIMKPDDWPGGKDLYLIELLGISERLGEQLTWLSGLMDGVNDGPGCLGECPIFIKQNRHDCGNLDIGYRN